MDNETWIIETGHRVIEKMTRVGFAGLSTWERLVYALWVADYGMRNAGTLQAAHDLYADYRKVAFEAAEALSLSICRDAFAAAQELLEIRYFDLFESICDEIRNAEPAGAA